MSAALLSAEALAEAFLVGVAYAYVRGLEASVPEAPAGAGRARRVAYRLGRSVSRWWLPAAALANAAVALAADGVLEQQSWLLATVTGVAWALAQGLEFSMRRRNRLTVLPRVDAEFEGDDAGAAS